MEAMPRPRKAFVQRETTRHGKTVWYFRRGDGQRIRLHGEYGSAEWNADYEAALSGQKRPEPARSQAGTLRWLVERYYDSMAFAALRPATQKQRRSLLNGMVATGGDLHFRSITTADIIAGMDRRKATPAQAVSFVKANRGLYKWAMKATHVDHDPTAGVSAADPKTDGHIPWTEDDLDKYRKRHAPGSMARLALDILLFVGMRAGDAILFGRQHVRGDIIDYRSQKTGVEVVAPLLEPLAKSIEAAGAKDRLTFLVTEFGTPFSSVNSFGNWFRKRCREAGVTKTAHGIRKGSATIAAENGATDRELMALYGWETEKQAGVYTRKADRARLAKQAAEKLKAGTSIPAPGIPVRGSERKAQ